LGEVPRSYTRRASPPRCSVAGIRSWNKILRLVMQPNRTNTRGATQVLRFNDFHNNFEVEWAGSPRVSAAGIGNAGQLRDH
jgi:hypothetical protein